MSEKQLIIRWFLESIDADMENRKIQSLWEALDSEEVQDDIKGGDLAIFGLDSISSFSTVWTDSLSSRSVWTLSSSDLLSISTYHTTISELEDEDLVQKMLLVMYLQSIRYLKPREGNNSISEKLFLL